MATKFSDIVKANPGELAEAAELARKVTEAYNSLATGLDSDDFRTTMEGILYSTIYQPQLDMVLKRCMTVTEVS